MPPKKQAAETKASPPFLPGRFSADQRTQILLGRPGNNLKIGIVGVPNVGKSSFFNALTNTSACCFWIGLDRPLTRLQAMRLPPTTHTRRLIPK